LDQRAIVYQDVRFSAEKSENWLLIDDAAKGEVDCIDGRTTHPVFGVPGGSAGVLLRIIGAYIASLPNQLQQAAVKQTVAQFPELCDAFRLEAPLCSHTDNHAEAKHELTGCGYYKKLRDESRDFGYLGGEVLVPALVNALIPSDVCEVLQGKHQELGMLEITTTGKWIPKIQPMTNGTQHFVYHPQVEQALYRRLEPGMLVVLQRLNGTAVQLVGYREKLRKLTDRHVAVTLAKIANGKSVNQVVCNDQREFVVKETSAV